MAAAVDQPNIKSWRIRFTAEGGSLDSLGWQEGAAEAGQELQVIRTTWEYLSNGQARKGSDTADSATEGAAVSTVIHTAPAPDRHTRNVQPAQVGLEQPI